MTSPKKPTASARRKLAHQKIKKAHAKGRLVPGTVPPQIRKPGRIVEQDQSPLAEGFDLELLPSGHVLIEFFGDDQKTFTKVVATRQVIESFPTVVAMFELVHGKLPGTLPRKKQNEKD